MIELSGVSRWFDQLLAVDQVTFNVAEGEIVGLLGHNGAGKTTLIRVINGLLTPHAGSVRVLGHDPVTKGREVRQVTGVLTEYPALDEYLTTRENLEVYAAINGLDRHVAAARIDDLLQRLGLWDKRDEPARGLSAGLKQRVAIARGLVHDPRILLLDEPTTNMDPVAARDVRALILESVRERGRTVLLSTHNLAEAEALCDRVAIMRRGRLLTVGPPSDLRRGLGGVNGVRIRSTAGSTQSIVAIAGNGHDAQILDNATVQLSGQVAIPVLVARLVEAGIEVHGVDPLEPSLEDLYVALHDEADNPVEAGR